MSYKENANIFTSSNKRTQEAVIEDAKQTELIERDLADCCLPPSRSFCL